MIDPVHSHELLQTLVDTFRGNPWEMKKKLFFLWFGTLVLKMKIGPMSMHLGSLLYCLLGTHEYHCEVFSFSRRCL